MEEVLCIEWERGRDYGVYCFVLFCFFVLCCVVLCIGEEVVFGDLCGCVVGWWYRGDVGVGDGL